jgi:hypothetical protein
MALIIVRAMSAVDRAAEEHGLVGRRGHVQHHQPSPEIEECTDVGRLVVRREELAPGSMSFEK